MKLINSVLALSAIVILTGCGGSSGDGDSPSSTTLPVVNAVEAEATVANGEEATEVVTEMGDVTEMGSLLAVEDEGKAASFDKLEFISLQQNIVTDILSKEAVALNQAINESDTCDNGGTYSYVGSQTETAYNMTTTFNNCDMYGTLMNGSMSIAMTGTNYGETVASTDIKITSDYSVTVDSSLAVKLYAGSYFNVKYTGYADDDNFEGTLKSSLWFESSGIKARYDDLEVDFSVNGAAYEVRNCYKAGRVYINNITEYLDIDTEYDPNCDFSFVNDGTGLVSGSLEYTFSSGQKIHAEVTSTDEITYTVVN
ncbi:MAG: hypothetical protein U9Q40_02215 [Campylobacterota bacterium]|nr:hypothetical protein [Campylobacterota bacterium]